MQGLDLLGVHKKVRQLRSHKRLFQLWNAVRRLHDRGNINGHELDEIQTVICSQLGNIESGNNQRTSEKAA